MDARDTMDPQAVAELLHADAATVMQYARVGALPGTRIGKGWIFLREDVLRFLKDRIEKDTQARRQKAMAIASDPVAVFTAVARPRGRRTVLPALPHMPIQGELPTKDE